MHPVGVWSRCLVAGSAGLLLTAVAGGRAAAQLVSTDSMFQALATERQAAAEKARPRRPVRLLVRPVPVRRELKQLDAVGSANRALLMPVLERVKPAGLPLGLAAAVVALESGWHIEVRGSRGEIGLMQIKPETAVRFAERDVVVVDTASLATSLGITTGSAAGVIAAVSAEAAANAGTPATGIATADAASTAGTDLFEPETNLRIGMRFLDWCYGRAKHDVALTIGCYNAGPSRMYDWNQLPTTRDYVSQVHGLMEQAGDARLTPTSASPAPAGTARAGRGQKAGAVARTRPAAADAAAPRPFVSWEP
jgi:hypothetical protein